MTRNLAALFSADRSENIFHFQASPFRNAIPGGDPGKCMKSQSKQCFGRHGELCGCQCLRGNPEKAWQPLVQQCFGRHGELCGCECLGWWESWKPYNPRGKLHQFRGDNCPLSILSPPIEPTSLLAAAGYCLRLLLLFFFLAIGFFQPESSPLFWVWQAELGRR